MRNCLAAVAATAAAVAAAAAVSCRGIKFNYCTKLQYDDADNDDDNDSESMTNAPNICECRQGRP